MKSVQVEASEVSKGSSSSQSLSRGLSVIDFILRTLASFGTLASAIAMGTTRQTLPFVTRFVRFKAVYKDLPTLTFFVIANSVVCGYLVISLPLSFFHVVKCKVTKSRIILIIFDTVMMALLTAGASSAAAIVNLAHNGNTNANWFAICRQFNSFCQRISGSLIGSFVAVVVFILLIIISAVVISRR
ncbi:Casparian strip membrane protein [Parasponia andersonii]|uniref:CASP-like protein n=1 Tax=Parasponia andersonii TaxID=3476 RepID=A0A2P5BZE5_PARAD|nr:Casparian strip membrane protein [Parasponia andersonii]